MPVEKLGFCSEAQSVEVQTIHSSQSDAYLLLNIPPPIAINPKNYNNVFIISLSFAAYCMLNKF